MWHFLRILCKGIRLNLYRMLYLNLCLYEPTAHHVRIEPIQNVVFKCRVQSWCKVESLLNLYRMLYLNQLYVSKFLCTSVIEPIQNVVFKYNLKPFQTKRAMIEPIQNVVFK